MTKIVIAHKKDGFLIVLFHVQVIFNETLCQNFQLQSGIR